MFFLGLMLGIPFGMCIAFYCVAAERKRLALRDWTHYHHG